jgi:hypothetical protein
MNNHLTEYDIEQLKAGAGHHYGNIAIPREVFDILLRDVRLVPDSLTSGFAFNLQDAVRKV